MKRHRPLFLPVVALSISAALAGCSRAGGGGAGGADPDASGSTRAAALVDYSNGLSAAERERYYHLAEGSEVLPLAWVKAVKSVATNRLFMQDLERFGLIPDPDNPDGLAVGMTGAPTMDTRLFGVRMMGLNCAACHVNEVTYAGRRIRIDGAPALFFADAFKAELKGSLEHTLKDPVEFIAFLRRLRREHEPHNPHLPAEAARTATQVLQASPHPDSAAAAQHGGRNPLHWVHQAIEAERRRPPVDMLVGLHVSPVGGRAAPRLPEPLTAEHAQRTAAALVPDDAHPSTLFGRGVQDVEHFISDVILTYRLLKARVHSFRRIAPVVPGSTGGPGRVDAFDVARNVLFPRDSVPTTAPVSYPFLWGFAKQNWLHYDGNTNSVMQRNIGQAIGVGAVYDSTTLISTLNPRNLYELEGLSRKIESPRWPEEVFGRIDREKASRGEALFQANCQSCHNAQAPDPLFAAGPTGTDSMRLVNFGKPMSDGRYFLEWAGPALDGLATQAYRVNRVPADTVQMMNRTQDGDSITWRTTGKWSSRPLNGIWATAPYLHNNSVPTLYHLLLPAAQRPKSFVVGHREYDPRRLGFNEKGSGPLAWTFHTDSIGNSNTGHEYGTRLSEAERMDLLEYLKGH